MAGLEKYEASEEWKNKFKKLLFMERKTVLKTSETIKETQRYSMDISVDLQNILKEKNIPRPGETPKANKQFEQENKENNFVKMEFPRNRVHFEDINAYQGIVDETLLDVHEQSNRKQDISDESFEALEKMCDKTGSDPDSTLFQYLNSENKREVIEATKKRRSAIDQSEEDADAAIDKLLNNLRFQDQLEDESPIKGIETTQIEDIEAPSRFWDSTMLQTSPVKMVGLLRPSTILECADESDISSTQTSYKSTAKALPSEISSSCYETASETASFYKPWKTTETELDPLSIENLQADREVDPLSLENEYTNQINESRNLIDLEKTMALSNASLNNAPETPAADLIQNTCQEETNEYAIESDESVIELLSDEENPLSPFCSSNPAFENSVKTPFNDGHRTLIKWETPFEFKKELTSTSIDYSSNTSDNRTSISPKEESLHFNDTLEEVEYMMKKGMEMMRADNAVNESPVKAKNASLTPNILKEKQNTFTVSPKEHDQLKSPFTGMSANRNVTSPKATPTSTSKSKVADRFLLNMKPMPKFDIFKKPSSACKPSSITPRHKDQFAHVISPIGTYVKKTAVTPLMTTTKATTGDLNSTAFRELEYESRLYQPKFNLHDGKGNTKLLKSPNVRTLPKKAYISSELRQITDERSPVTIPGGKKIQKYLDAAVMPAVIRHNGKAKITGCTSKMPVKLQRIGVNSPNTPKRQDSKNISLANLSVMSGDVSVYTIKDAQKL